MIDTDSVKKHIRFIVQHYGTNTQGAEYRYDQVSEYLVEFILRLQAYNAAIEEARKQFSEDIAGQFKLAVD